MLLLHCRFSYSPSIQRNFKTCEQCPDYYPGEEPDSSTIGTVSPGNQWEGRYAVSDDWSWDGGFCKTLSITNGSNKATEEFEVLSFITLCELVNALYQELPDNNTLGVAD